VCCLAKGWLAGARWRTGRSHAHPIRSALALYPRNPRCSERLMWFFIDHRRVADLPMMDPSAGVPLRAVTQRATCGYLRGRQSVCSAA